MADDDKGKTEATAFAPRQCPIPRKPPPSSGRAAVPHPSMTVCEFSPLEWQVPTMRGASELPPSRDSQKSPTAQKRSCCACLFLFLPFVPVCAFVPVVRFLCRVTHRSICLLLRANSSLSPFFLWLKNIVYKKGAAGFKTPPFPPKKLFLVSSL